MNPLTPALAVHVDALRANVPAHTVADAAQARLLDRLDTAQARPRAWFRELAGAALASCALVVLLVSPLFVAREVVAFDDVQRRFHDFTTLVMTIEQQTGGVALPPNTVTAMRDGRVRVDVGAQLSVVLDPRSGRGVSLLHEARLAQPFAFAPGGRGTEAVDWLEELRTFRGIATPIEATRTIEGRTAYGWVLELAGQRTELWADADGLPLAMTVGPSASTTLRFAFAFDVPVDASRFELAPAGYATAGAED